MNRYRAYPDDIAKHLQVGDVLMADHPIAFTHDRDLIKDYGWVGAVRGRISELPAGVGLRLDTIGDRELSFSIVKGFDPNQPRNPAGAQGGGQWTSGGGGGSVVISHARGVLEGYHPNQASSATELYSRTADLSITSEMVYAAVPGSRDKAQEAERKIAQGTQTKDQHFVGGVYTAERQALHDAIIEKIFTAEAIERATPGADEDPTLVFLGGRGGAGKSWFSRAADSPIDAKKFLYLNSDDIKEALPEYEGWNAALVHEESSDILSRANHIARSAGLNVIVDATMRSSGSISRELDKYEDAGYRAEGYFMHTAPQVSAVRALGRFVSSGRYVPPAYVLSSTTNEATFDSMTNRFERWAVYDNNTNAGPVRVVNYD